MADYIAPSIETIEKHNLWHFAKRALGLIHAVQEVEHNVWIIKDYVVRWDGAGFVCQCWNWEAFHQKQGGFCKHSLAVALRSASYRDRIIAAMDERSMSCQTRR